MYKTKVEAVFANKDYTITVELVNGKAILQTTKGKYGLTESEEVYYDELPRRYTTRLKSGILIEFGLYGKYVPNKDNSGNELVNYYALTYWTPLKGENGEVKCEECNGTGSYSTGKVCYRCGGKGWQDKDDQKRNTYYDKEIRPSKIAERSGTVISSTVELYQVDAGYACFGLVVEDGIVTRTAPISKYSLGRKIEEVISYYKNAKNAIIVKL